MRVKICGITSVDDAHLAEEAGADAIGVVVCSHSPRNVGLGKAEEIFAAVGPYLTTVCVTATQSANDMDSILSLRPDAVQVSYPFTIPADTGVKRMRTVAPGDDLPADCDAVVIDGSRGRGMPYDQAFALEVRKRSPLPVILAGGLTCRNVRGAIEKVRPYAVDVASGVESAPGRKDRGLLEAFMNICKERSND